LQNAAWAFRGFQRGVNRLCNFGAKEFFPALSANPHRHTIENQQLALPANLARRQAFFHNASAEIAIVILMFRNCSSMSFRALFRWTKVLPQCMEVE
jgi:hypothetical protein